MRWTWKEIRQELARTLIPIAVFIFCVVFFGGKLTPLMMAVTRLHNYPNAAFFISCGFVYTLFLIARAIAQRWQWWCERRKFVRVLMLSVGGGTSRWPLRRVPDAIARCDRLDIFIPGIAPRTPADTEPSHECFACGDPATIDTMEPCSITPSSYRRFRTFARQAERRAQRGRVLVNTHWARGIERSAYFCSRTCYASFLLWLFFIPTNFRERVHRIGISILTVVQDAVHWLIGY